MSVSSATIVLEKRDNVILFGQSSLTGAVYALQFLYLLENSWIVILTVYVAIKGGNR